ncbi:cobyric acid synthase [Gordonia shandongensis]|uniref:cobyric acid synthase n=1 Tax=Gordonia shandongensis TaxID=376351 RepID=UPI0003FC01B1|nr:cobyric acid synthase [Gordonia shandongensis]
MSTAGAILVGGTSSDAGKSLVVAGLCRALARQGIAVAPFKAQNMSNNAAVTLDGGEIGRAQALQARACGVEPDTRFNPVLLKPGGDRRSHVVVRGVTVGDVGAADYHARRAELATVVADELASLRSEFDAVICEGAGSVAEINLRSTDIANMGLARAADLPVLVVSDIDRGGSLAHLFGTTAILAPEDQALIAGFVINKFRGDPAILEPGLEMLAERTGRRTLGVIPFSDGLWLDAEDSLSAPVGRRVGGPRPTLAAGRTRLSVAAVRLPRISNSTDVEALACEPDVDVVWVDDPAAVRQADLAVLPGTRATIDDLAWLRRTGIADAVVARAAQGRPLLGICGGFQMLGRELVDTVESGAGRVGGLGVFDLDIEFRRTKTLREFHGDDGRAPVDGYEIHHGAVVRSGEAPWLHERTLGPEGAQRGAVYGTHCHGLLESDDFRRGLLRDVAVAAGRGGFSPDPSVDVTGVRTGQLDLMADLITEHIDMPEIHRLLDGRSRRRPTVLSWLSDDFSPHRRP